jgi:hypothetical protein
MSLDSQAQAISTRLRAPSLRWMAVRWPLTVLSEMNSSAAISWLVRPAGTPFEAIGEYPNGAWFGGQMFDAADKGIHATTADAALSIALLLAAALAALAITHLVLSKRAERSVS